MRKSRTTSELQTTSSRCKPIQGFLDASSLDVWRCRVLVDEELSAQMLKGIGGAWQRRSDDRMRELETTEAQTETEIRQVQAR